MATIGVFDGVHRGHQHLLARLRDEAQRRGWRSAVVVFRNSPQQVLRPQEPEVPCLTGPEERVRLLRQQGVDLVTPLTFDLELSSLRAEAFLAMLKEALDLRGLVMGPWFALGHGREVHTLPALQEIGERMGFTVQGVEPLDVDGHPVSSTAVREALARGEVDHTARLLGRPFTLPGRVVRGEGRGRVLGFPTANLEVDAALAIPANGVYATWASVLGTGVKEQGSRTAGEGSRYASATSIGVRPTFGPGPRTVETHLLDYSGDLYGQEVRLEFASRLREERCFENQETLVAQMRQDVAHAQVALASRASKGLGVGGPAPSTQRSRDPLRKSTGRAA
jgi:riboflavin kinase/FMN adenylyltransferase